MDKWFDTQIWITGVIHELIFIIIGKKKKSLEESWDSFKCFFSHHTLLKLCQNRCLDQLSLQLISTLQRQGFLHVMNVGVRTRFFPVLWTQQRVQTGENSEIRMCFAVLRVRTFCFPILTRTLEKRQHLPSFQSANRVKDFFSVVRFKPTPQKGDIFTTLPHILGYPD